MYSKIFASILFLSSFFTDYSISSGNDSGPEIPREAMKSLETFGRNLGKKYNLRYLNRGIGVIVESKHVALELSLLGPQKFEIGSARKFILNIVNDFVTTVQKNPAYHEYMKEEAKYNKGFDPNFSPERIGIRITFWDENIDRQMPPYIAQIIVKEGKIFYYSANVKDQSLQEPIIETFDQASEHS